MSDLEKDIEEGLKGGSFIKQTYLIRYLAELIVIRNYLIQKSLTFDKHSEDAVAIYNRTYFQKRIELINNRIITLEPKINYKDL